MSKTTRLFMLLIFCLFLIGSTALLQAAFENIPEKFSGERAYADVLHQVDLGPRIPGSAAHAQTVTWIVAELEKAGWSVEIQELSRAGKPVRNIIARRGSGAQVVLLGAHFDSRLEASQESRPDLRAQPVPGANDGASGVAVLLEMARTLPETIRDETWLVFFDAEDQGALPGWQDWSIGATLFVENLERSPDIAVIIDMIGDTDLNLYFERNSDQELSRQIWAVAQQSGFAAQFIAEPKHSITDDHIPFIKAGIPAVDIIDFDYPYWHTLQDTADKVSADSLQAVGETLINWLVSR